jgi:DNA-binding transcriptional LysR family regulator
VVPTALALAIADAARQMADGADALGQSLAGRAATTGTVRITTSEVAALWLLPPVLAALQAAEPGIQVELVAPTR